MQIWGVLQGWVGPERLKPFQRSTRSMPAHIPHQIERPHGILLQRVREKGIDSNQKWEVREREEPQGI